ncbi:hypothetical protein OEZ71_19015 [Defluviimonas sp. WL0050]|uniref:UrcA family protein n=1 Tax=Albidovulum litorale TaxID=2984134 RepID=A0ABT2ZTP1_9RHOB|nr:hypothetical protein [Defluviimonas sp. WL0050]MCV2874394.1 hypothetical protein [Defluviimonas sp. WL0050]
MRCLWMLAVALAGALMLPGAGRAAEQECRANLNGVEVAIRYDRKAEVYSSFREKRLTRRKTCPGAVVIAYMVPGLTEAERAVFCAVYDKKSDEYRTVAEGRRDAYGRCAQPSRACRIVNATKDEVVQIGSVGVGAMARGVTSVRDQAGVLVLTGQASALAALLTETGTAVAATLNAPGVLAGAAASVVVVGGAVYVCR